MTRKLMEGVRHSLINVLSGCEKMPILAVIVFLCCHTAFSAPNGVATSEGYEITVAAGTDLTLNSDDVTALGASTTMIKKGGGRLIIDTDLASAGWDGEIKIEEGYLRAYAVPSGTLGGTTKGTFITVGASLEAHDNSTSYGEKFLREPLTMGGSGVNGCGALYCSRNGSSTQGMFGRSPVTLTSDTVIGYVGSESFGGSMGFRNGNSDSKRINMNGHSLTFHGSGSCGLYNQIVSNPGNIYVGNTGTFTIENNSDLSGNASKIMQFAANARFVSQNEGRQYFKHSFRSLGSMSFTCGNGKSWIGYPGWTGPMELGGELTLISVTHPAEFAGNITGTGGIKLSNSSTVLSLMGTNTYGGATKVVSGTTLKAKRLAAIPGMSEGRLSIADGGTVEVDVKNAEENRDSDIFAACVGTTTNSTWSFDSAHLWMDPGTRVLSDPISKFGVYDFAPSGDGVFTLASAISGSPDLEFKSGTTAVTGSGEVGTINVLGGKVVIADGANLSVTNGDVFITGDYPDVGRLVVTNGGTLGGIKNGIACTLGAGHSAQTISSTGRGIFEMFDGATVIGKFDSSAVNGSRGKGSDQYMDAHAMGAWYQHGGFWDFRKGASSLFLGDFRGAYYSQEGGTTVLDASGNLRVSRDAKSYAVWHHRGGSFVMGGDYSYLYLGVNGGSADLVVSGGRFSMTNSLLYICRPLMENNYPGTHNTLSVIGDGVFDFTIMTAGHDWCGFQCACLPGSIATVNINGNGVLRTPKIQKTLTGTITKVPNVSGTLTNNHTFVNFDGGTLEATSVYLVKDSRIFRNFSNDTDRVTVYAGGATISTPKEDLVLGAALEAPTGNGVESIPIPDGIAALNPWDYIGAPKVVITDPTGVGTGATAIAEFDTLRGVITNFTVTSRGRNYTSPVVTITKGGYTNSFTTTAITSPNASGGFTKKGAKALTIDRVCSYTGATAVKEGILKLGVANAIDTSSVVQISAGATFDLNGCESAVPVSGSGTVTGDARVASDWRVRGADLAAAGILSSSGTLSIPAGCVLTVEGPEALTGRKYQLANATSLVGPVPMLEGLPTEWTIRKDGNSLWLVNPKGFVMVFK